MISKFFTQEFMCEFFRLGRGFTEIGKKLGLKIIIDIGIVSQNYSTRMGLFQI
jgi:hypothetical protein